MAKPRSKSQRERNRTLIADLYLKGYTQMQIKDILFQEYQISTTQGTISNDINNIINDWRKEQREKIEELKLIELKRINKLETQAWEAWERSKEQKETTNQKKRSQGGKKQNKQNQSETNNIYTEIGIRREQSAGDVRYLSEVHWCITKRCELLGLNAPIGIETQITLADIAKGAIRKVEQNE